MDENDTLPNNMNTQFSDLSWRMKVFIVALPIFLSILLWNIASWHPRIVGAPTIKVQTRPNRQQTNGQPIAVAFSPDNKFLSISRENLAFGNAWAYFSNQIDLQTGFRWGKFSRTIHAPKKAVAQGDSSISASPFHHMQFSPDSRFIAGTGASHDFALIRVKSGTTVLVLKDSNLPKTSPYHSRDYLLVGFTRDNKRVLVLERWAGVRNVDVGIDAEAKALHKADLLTIDTITGKIISRVNIQLKVGQWPERAVLVNDKSFVCTTERGDEMSSFEGGGTASLFNVRSGKIIRVLASGHTETHSMAFSTQGLVAVSYAQTQGKDTTIIYNLSTNQKVVLDDNRGVENLAFSPNGKQIAGTQSDAIWLWNTSTGKGIRRIGTNPRITDLTFSPDGKTLASVDFENAKIWRVE